MAWDLIERVKLGVKVLNFRMSAHLVTFVALIGGEALSSLVSWVSLASTHPKLVKTNLPEVEFLAPSHEVAVSADQLH